MPFDLLNPPCAIRAHGTNLVASIALCLPYRRLAAGRVTLRGLGRVKSIAGAAVP